MIAVHRRRRRRHHHRRHRRRRQVPRPIFTTGVPVATTSTYSVVLLSMMVLLDLATTTL